MRLLTHNTLRNNSAEAKGKGFPLKITATEIRVEENKEDITEQQLDFVRNMLSRLDWPALVQVRTVTCQEVPHWRQKKCNPEMAFLTFFLYCFYFLNVFLQKNYRPAHKWAYRLSRQS